MLSSSFLVLFFSAIGSTSTHSTLFNGLIKATFKTSSTFLTGMISIISKTVLDTIEVIPVKNVEEVLKVALTKPLKRVEWVEVDQISKKDKLKKELSTH